MVAGKRECRAPGLWVKTVSGGEFGYVHLRSSPVYRQRHVSRDWNANREVPPAFSDAPISATHEVGHVRAVGTAHVVVVAMMPVITSRTSEGPLDCAGHPQRKVEGAWLRSVNFGCTDGPQRNSISRSENVGSACSFKRMAKCASNRKGRLHMKWHGLKPDSRNETVRDYRGLGGNGCVASFQPGGGMPRVCNGIWQYGTNCATTLLGMDVTDAVYRAHREEQLEGAVRLLTYTLFPTERNLKALGKNGDAVRRLYSGKTEREIVEGMLPTIRHLYGGDSIIGKFLNALDERKKEFFLYLDDPLVSKTSNLAEQHFSMNSSIFKRRFKTKNGLLNTSFLFHEHIRISRKS